MESEESDVNTTKKTICLDTVKMSSGDALNEALENQGDDSRLTWLSLRAPLIHEPAQVCPL